MSVTLKTGPTQQDAAKALKILQPWLSNGQCATLRALCRETTEEHEHFRAKCVEYAERVQAMPQTYGTEGEGDKAMVYLHYFVGACDWHITEKDSDPDNEGQIQAFGLANLGFGGELGYINVVELVKHNAELDLYWTPKPLSQVKS